MWSELLYIEIMKLKRSFIVWLIFVVAITAVTLSYISLHLNSVYNYIPVTWYELLKGNLVYLNLLFASPVFSLVTSYIFVREYHDHVIYQLFSYPVSRVKIIVSKLLVIILFIMVTMLLSFLLTMVLGSIVIGEYQSTVPIHGFFKIYVYSIFLQLSIVPISMLLSIWKKSIVYPVSITVVGLVIGFFILGESYDSYFPWSAPTRVVFELIGTKALNVDIVHPVIMLATVFVVTLVPSIFLFRYLDNFDWTGK